MVLYLNHYSPSAATCNNMYPTSNRHPTQNFGIGPYGYPAQQAGQYGGANAVSDMGCTVAPYQMAGLGNMSDGSLQQASPSAMTMTPSWHTPAVYMSSCSRGPVPFEDWTHGQPGQASLSSSPCSHVPVSVGLTVSSSPHLQSQHVVNCAGFGAHAAYNKLNGPSSNETTASGGEQEYSAQVQVQDLTHSSGGHHSPDSGLTVSSDGVSSSDSPQHVPANHPHHHHHHHHHHPPHPHSHVQTMNRPTPVRSPFEWMKSKSSYQSQPNPGHPRSSSKGLDVSLTEGGKTRTKDKYRVVYSDHQRLELEKEFHYSRYITIRRKAELAQMLGLSERQVKIWFQNRRAKERKQGKKRDELKIKDPVMMTPNQLQVPPGGLLPTLK